MIASRRRSSILVGAVHPLVDGLRHILGCDQAAAGAARPEGCFAHDVVDVREARRELALILDQPRRILDDFAHRGDVEVEQALLLDAVADELGDAHLVFRRPTHLDGEIGPHFEQLLELLIVGVERVVGRRVADEHHLHIERDRLGGEGGGHEHPGLEAFLDADAAVAQPLLERLPRERLAEQHTRIEHQVAAVRSVQRAGLDMPIIADQRAELGAHLDAADQVGVGRIRLDDHRRAAQIAIVHDDVEMILVERRAGVRLQPQRHILPCRGAILHLLPLSGGAQLDLEVVGMLRDVSLHIQQIGEHIGPRGIFGRQPLEGLADGRRGDLLIEVRQAVVGCFLDLAHLTESALQRLLQRLAALVERLLFRVRQRIELLLRHRFAVASRRDPHAGGRADQREALLARGGVQLAQAIIPLVRQLARDRVAMLGILVAGERLGQRIGDTQEQRVHLIAQLASPAGRQPDGLRAIGVLEIVDVAPVGRHRPSGSPVFEKTRERRRLACAAGTHREDVVARIRHLDAELDGARGTRLADDALQLRRVGGGGEGEMGCLATAAQLLSG